MPCPEDELLFELDELERRARETAALLLLLLFLALVLLVRITDWDGILCWLRIWAFSNLCLALVELPTSRDDDEAAEAARTIAGRQQDEFIFIYVFVCFVEKDTMSTEDIGDK